MNLPSIAETRFAPGTRVLLRVDFNVPLTDGKVDEDGDWRIARTLPTIELLLKRGAKVIIASHLGRPEGKKLAALKLDPVAKRLSQLLGRPVLKLDDVIGAKALSAVESMGAGEVVMLENLRFQAGEDRDDAKFAKALAALADIYVDDAFAVCHRKAASISSITKLLPSCAGLLLESEVAALSRLLDRPARPYLAVMGGAKVSSKIGVIGRMLEIADRVLIGGALVNPFYRALGYGVGSSLTSAEDEAAAKKLLASPLHAKLVLPGDVIVGNPKRPGDHAEAVDLLIGPHEIAAKGRAILDIGPKTISAYASFLRSAKTIIWNGPLGLFESPRFAHGTLALGRLIAARSKGRAFGVVGGGESVMALRRTGLMDCVDHVSTGGGAMLEFLEGKPLPGLEALIKSRN